MSRIIKAGHELDTSWTFPGGSKTGISVWSQEKYSSSVLVHFKPKQALNAAPGRMWRKKEAGRWRQINQSLKYFWAHSSTYQQYSNAAYCEACLMEEMKNHHPLQALTTVTYSSTRATVIFLFSSRVVKLGLFICPARMSRPLVLHFPRRGGRDIILGVSRPILLPHLTASSRLAALQRARPFCCRSLFYHTLGCRNSAFVMAVISLLCSQVELRWNSTGSHCVPIFRTLKEICWVLKGWNEARGAWADCALWGNTQQKHNGNNLVLQFPFVLC